MALFCAAIRTDSVSLISFPFPIYVQTFSVRQFVAWKTHTFVFFQFLFLVIVLYALMLSVLLLPAVISVSLLFFYVVFESSYCCIHAIFNAGKSTSSSSFISQLI